MVDLNNTASKTAWTSTVTFWHTLVTLYNRLHSRLVVQPAAQCKRSLTKDRQDKSRPKFTCLQTRAWKFENLKFVLCGGSVAEWLAYWTQALVQIAVATLSGNSLRQTVHTHLASVHQAAKLVAALLRVARVTVGLAESNGSLQSGLWLTSSAGWLPRTGISSGTLRLVIEYGLPFYLAFQHISSTVLHARSSGIFCTLPMSVARSSSGRVAIRVMYFRFYGWRHVCAYWPRFSRNKRRSSDSVWSSTDLTPRRILKLTHWGQHRTGGGIWYLRLSCFSPTLHDTSLAYPQYWHNG